MSSILTKNSEVKKLYKTRIDEILKEMYPHKWKDVNQYEGNTMSGIYDLEKKGRSIINYLNTNYVCFSMLLEDVNKVIKHEKNTQINFFGLSPKEEIEETKKFLGYIYEYRTRIFSQETNMFNKIIQKLEILNKKGENTENFTSKLLKNKFGINNVKLNGGSGVSSDAIGGVDCVVTINENKITGQIKPFTKFFKKGEKIIVVTPSLIKHYPTRWLIFTNTINKEVLIFRNTNTEIVDGNYTFNEKDLIYFLR